MSIMEIKGVRYSYDNKRNVLKGVSAELEAGKMYAILGPSGCGKTTLLRDCIRQISNGYAGHAGMSVGVVDERSEIAGSYQGTFGNDVGLRTDVLDGCPKSEGLMLLIRSMAPGVVAVDEIGGSQDINALASAMNCGCVLMATVHGSRMEDLKSRPF